MFRPPVQRAMRQLDRTLFNKDVTIAAARIFDAKVISRIRSDFHRSHDVLNFRAVSPITLDPEDASKQRKCLLLREGTRPDDKSTWSETTKRLDDAGEVKIFPYLLHLNYEHWTAHDILQAILPEELHYDIPTGFNLVGHIAHYNLRERYLPYKFIIGAVTMDKNPAIRTVVNKTETLGEENEFRVLEHELIAGEPDFDVEAREGGCSFRFNFAKVFWNSKLGTEHQRLVDKFKPGEAVCDVMAGVGPFAMPAGKKGVFVWGNDLNPDCYEGLKVAIGLNKAGEFVQAFCEDGHTFIKDAAKRLLSEGYTAMVPKKLSRTDAQRMKPGDRITQIPRPKIFSHYVMNLPATAIDFLPDFIGLYTGHEDLFTPTTDQRLPMIHCYCFAPKSDSDDPDAADPRKVICEQLTEKLGHNFTPQTTELEIWDVRNVAPNKSQYCASFRLPAEVAFRSR